MRLYPAPSPISSERSLSLDVGCRLLAIGYWLLECADRRTPDHSASDLDALHMLRANPCVSAPLRLCVDFPEFSLMFVHSVEPVTNLGRRKPFISPSRQHGTYKSETTL
jgi:hypothetical protein